MRFVTSKGVPRYLLLAVTAMVVGCQRPGGATIAEEAPAGPCWFVDDTERIGLNFVHDAGPLPTAGRYFMPQIMGSGVAMFDFDAEGQVKYLYFIQNAGAGSSSPNQLFRRGPGGRFENISRGSGLDIASYGMGVAIGDVNNDGLPDVYVTDYGGGHLFLNNGDDTFTDVTKEAGLDNPLWGTSASFVDFDRDGRLDLVVVNYVEYNPSHYCASGGGKRDYCHPNQFKGTVTRLYRNLGPIPGSKKRSVRFEDVTLAAGLGTHPGPGLGVVCADFNGDHWPDIFVANDSEPNCLWINQRNGTFREEAILRGVAYNVGGQQQANMGVTIGDVAGTGRFDVFVTHLTEETNTLWQQVQPGFFKDATAAARLASSRWRGTGFGTFMGDFDHDGALDIAIVNGRVTRRQGATAADPFLRGYGDRNQLFANDGTGRFRDISPQNTAFCGMDNIARGLACGDIDGDGALDLLVTSVAGPARFYRNVTPDRGHWLLVRAIDPAVKRDAYGAEIVVEAGGRRWWRLINPGQSYLSSNDPRVHFGLGKAERVDRIRVTWADGNEEAFPGRPANQAVVLLKGSGQPGGK